MAHAFDTSLSRAQRTLIRAGAVTLLAGLKRPAGYLQAVVPWGGIVRSFQDDLGIDLLWQTLAGRAPAMAIALGDKVSVPKGMGGFNFAGEIELIVYHISNHPRDLELGRLEIDVAGLAANTSDPGLDVMMEHAEELLIGQVAAVSNTIKQIRPHREEELRTEDGVTLWAQRYSVLVARTINPHRNVSTLLTEMRSAIRTSDAVTDVPAPPLVTVESAIGPTAQAAVALDDVSLVATATVT
jgi:hypothetical protein